MKIRHAPLFAGINGFGRAADMLGWEQPLHCEIDDFCQTLIQYYWKNSTPYYDITKSDYTFWRGKIDVLSGGFPCQPFSNAGNRNGVGDHRYLWPEYLRAIREIKPTAVVGENVTGLLTMEQHEMFARVDSRRIVRFENYDEFEGIYTRQATMLVNDICNDLEEEGYDVQPFVVPAAGVGAPHRRDRIWFIAYSDHYRKMRRSRVDAETGEGKGLSERDQVQQSEVPDNVRGFSSDPNGIGSDRRRPTGGGKKEGKEVGTGIQCQVEGSCGQQPITHPESGRSRGLRNQKEEAGPRKSNELSGSECGVSSHARDATDPCVLQLQRGQFNGGIGKKGSPEGEGGQFSRTVRNFWENFPTQPPICGGDDGLPTELDGITFSKWRNESIKAYGNAIVPQVAYEFFKAIDEHIKL